MLRAAWAVLLARYCETDDICFGNTISGRHAPIPGVERMAGPAVATVPVRVQIDRRQTVSSFLLGIQKQASHMVAYEQYGLQNISKVSPNAKDACNFSSLLVVQPIQQLSSASGNGQSVLVGADPEAGSLEKDGSSWMAGYFTYPLVIQALMMDGGVELHLTYDSAILDESQLSVLCDQFGHITTQLALHSESVLDEVSVAGPTDLQRAVDNNREDPNIVDACIHQLVDKQASIRPTAPAIQAWDREFTYQELSAASSRLASHLVNYRHQA
jgi:Non-ribosomal peptide synthetase modules and related proteins